MRNRKTTVDVARAWKDPAYRATLSSEELARIPASPVGMSELDPNVLGEVAGSGMDTTVRAVPSRFCWSQVTDYCKTLVGQKGGRSVGRLFG